jgi:beta-glucosidase
MGPLVDRLLGQQVADGVQDADARQPTRLIGWAQVELEPGSWAHVTVRCDSRVQQRWEDSTRSWVPLRSGTVLVGRSLGDLRATLPLSETLRG